MARRTLAEILSVGPTASPAACCTPLVSPKIAPGQAELAAHLFKALADPHRVRIVNMLANSPDPVCVCEITPRLGLAQGTVSFHLKKLLTAGLIEREQRGTWAYYSLRREALAQLSDVFDPERRTR